MKKNDLIVRAPNWIGDVVLCLPTWERLALHHHLHIAGKGWLSDLLSGYTDWSTYKLPAKLLDRRALYKTIQAHLSSDFYSQKINAVVFPTSFGSVFDMKLAGLKVLGHSHEGRGVFLTKAIKMLRADESIYLRNWDIGNALLNEIKEAPNQINFRINDAVKSDVDSILAAHSLKSNQYIVVCPFATGKLEGADKKWPHFSSWADKMQAKGYQLICCPSPSEQADWLKTCANIPAINGLNLSQYAAILKDALCVLANDTGPGHLAAAVGVPLVSVLNKTNVTTYGAIGPNVSIVKVDGWPDVDTVLNHVIDRIETM